LDHAGDRAVKVVVALDSFKGSLGSLAAGNAAAAGVRRAAPDAEVHVVGIADGGEGTLAVLLDSGRGREVVVDVVDALGRPVRAAYGLLGDGATAVVEAARTIGLPAVGLVDDTVPPRVSSFGLGQQLRHALGCGARRVLVGLGGSATTDGGLGLLIALGLVGRDDAGAALSGAAANPLWAFGSFDADTLPTLAGVDVVVLSDVTNPLLGELGAAAVFGPQKGCTPAQVAHLEARMTRWAAALEAATGRSVAGVPGAGAAGGIGEALLALGARIEPGFERVAAEVGLAEMLAGADLVITGEGSLDAQTAMGKGPAALAGMARAAGALVVGLGGAVDRTPRGPASLFDAVLPIHSRPRALAEALDAGLTATELAATAEQATRLVLRAWERGGRPAV
jgi:glycerate kinase